MSPSRMSCPRISTSAVAVRAMCVTGVVQRSISSTAPGINEGSSTSLRHSSGWSISASVPSAIRLRVVSLPATSSRKAKLSRSSSVRLSPSTSAVVKHRQHVVSRLRAPRGDQLLEVLEQLADRHERVHLDLGIGVPGARVGPPPELLPVIGRRTEQLGDHPGRQGRGDLLGEFVGVTGPDVVEDARRRSRGPSARGSPPAVG